MTLFIVSACSQNKTAPVYQAASKMMTAQTQDAQAKADLPKQDFFVALKPEIIVAKNALMLGELTPQIVRQTPERLRGLSRTQTISLEQLPLLTETREGIQFANMLGTPRAFVQATPASSCPVRSVGFDEKSTLNATQIALGRCLVALGQIGVSDRCDCRVMAQDNTLLDNLEAFTYARGVSAIFIEPYTDNTQSYIAEEIAQTTLDHQLEFYSLDKKVGQVTLFADGTLRATLDQLYTGHWYAEGYRRGHLVVRLYLETVQNEKLIAVIGYEPQELRERLSEMNEWIEE